KAKDMDKKIEDSNINANINNNNVSPNNYNTQFNQNYTNNGAKDITSDNEDAFERAFRIKNEEKVRLKLQKLSSRLVEPSSHEVLNITFLEWIQSYAWKTETLKKKLDLLNQGINRIHERLDIFNVFNLLTVV